MALLLSNAILHIVNNTGAASCYSNEELDVDSETCYEFVSKHVRRLLSNPGAREAVFSAQSQAYQWIKDYQKAEVSFKDLSRRLCDRLAGIMENNKDIPPADILIAAFDNGNKRYLAILKLNYGECFTHRVVESENGAENQIVKNMAVLPASGGKVEDACLIPWDPMVLRILEKPRIINGEEVNYFSGLFLECETELSKKETAEMIREITDEINGRYFDGNEEVSARFKCALMDEAASSGEDDELNLENAVRQVFGEHEEAMQEFSVLAKEYGLPHTLKLDKPFVQREFKTQRFKAENGIEIKFPAELFQDPETVQWAANSDGTVTVTLKNLRRYSNA